MVFRIIYRLGIETVINETDLSELLDNCRIYTVEGMHPNWVPNYFKYKLDPEYFYIFW
jgi:hypothetical protein